MANIIYSKLSGKNDPIYGKFEHPIKMLIENESNAYEKEKDILNLLYNVETSKRYAETIIGESDFDTFQSAREGQRAENDSVETTFSKTIMHIPFMKEFVITREMADDSRIGISADIKRQPQKLVRAYYRTRTKLAAQALIHATENMMVFNKSRVDLTCNDGGALFSNKHPYGTDKMGSATQSNYFYCKGAASNSGALEEALGTVSTTMRNFKDDNGDTLNYVPNILILPSNRAKLERIAKQVVGSERTTGTDFNDINTQYGQWTFCILPGWETQDDRFMVMSSAANKNLAGNNFYNRVALDIQNQVDIHTRNFIWNGYCRFGIGFAAWKHIALVADADSLEGASAL